MSILKIFYKNGERRIINLHKDFFSPVPTIVFNTKSHKMEKRIELPNTKATELAYALGNDPHVIVLEREGHLEMSKTIHSNEPVAKALPYSIDEKDIKKALRKEFRHKPFTDSKKLIYNAG